MKILFLIIGIIALSFGSVAQTLALLQQSYDCGTIEKKTTVSEWVTIDTLGHFMSKNREWIESDYSRLSEGVYTETLEYNPCKNPRPSQFVQYRICSITGIRQKRIKTEQMVYVKPPLTEYEKTVQSFTK